MLPAGAKQSPGGAGYKDLGLPNRRRCRGLATYQHTVSDCLNAVPFMNMSKVNIAPTTVNILTAGALPLLIKLLHRVEVELR